MTTEYTAFQNLPKPEKNAVDWDVELETHFDALDLATSGNRIATLLLDGTVAQYDAVGFSGATTQQHIVRATNDTATPIEACGVALAAGSAGDAIPVLMRGVLSLGTAINPSGPLTAGKALFLATDGGIRDEDDVRRYGDPDGTDYFIQKMGFVLRSSSLGENDVVFIAPSSGHRAINCTVQSAPAIVSSGAANDAWFNVSGSRYARTMEIGPGVTTRLVYTFQIPNHFRELPPITNWAFRVNYMVPGGATIDIYRAYGADGIAQTPAAADTGASATWTPFSVLSSELTAATLALAKCNSAAIEVVVAGGAAVSTHVETTALLRFGPEWGTWGNVI